MDGGMLFTQFSHFIDLLYWMMGDIHSVKGFQKFAHQNVAEFEDTLAASALFASGAIASMHFTVNAFKKIWKAPLPYLQRKAP